MVAVLFARRDSVYKTLGCDVYDIDRNAMNWQGGCPVVAHPPCRAWGRLHHFAKPRDGEKALGLWAVDQVRRFGGVLEHPKDSKLWAAAGMPKPGDRDEWGGWTLPVSQHWWGHRAEKLTWLYIVGVEPSQIPPMPIQLGEASHVIAGNKKKGQQGWRPQVTKAEREHTPAELAKWLVSLARGVH